MTATHGHEQIDRAECSHNTVRVEGRYADGGCYGHCANCNAEQFLEPFLTQGRRVHGGRSVNVQAPDKA